VSGGASREVELEVGVGVRAESGKGQVNLGNVEPETDEARRRTAAGPDCMRF